MSLILEALRKSEAERRRGQAPDLYAELPPHAPRRRHALSAWMWIAATVAVLIVVTWWLLRPLPTRTDEVIDPSPVLDAPAVEAPSTETDFPPISRIAPPPATPPPAARATTEPANTDATDAATAASDTRETVEAATGTKATMPTPPAIESRPAERTAAIAKITELSAEERRQLPAMKLSMHMWNERPERRFVILDGIRHAEGDRVGSATITAIDADGIILALNGRAVRLPLR